MRPDELFQRYVMFVAPFLPNRGKEMTDINLVHEIGDVIYEHQSCDCDARADGHVDLVDHQAQQVVNHLRDLGMVL
ncbi:hypothetical protein [Mycobacterium sp. CnD-18-1]|uniref:hypothetical protein n=1 Tax=Mycobacterium sp. CnD-18-1 TaxID=2917744 RepID=UPI001EF2A696|nr:hypothetical protein [Mycobacterium sp. CnD-18-1]MCG7607168.1 hypothetical protein [Mycobacterium sp. CnD-18-1]